ncbi:MAG TPA: 4-hydroxy-3-methylbut-2-enyl diphosphate reductase [Candidatus Baltobacteraceae bacterium]|jgi:4-hydroxy-3-methylbut-2-enyl diphosphate reductase|nr:4-hydroxy-3-methylbut-2-enyl diphosphate reductase [Candidatus Baltobacteraceae bacterium]
MAKMLLANPRGCCAGVDRAIAVVDELLDEHGGPVYVRKEIVHNREVVERLRERGAVFVEEVDEAPQGSILVFSAHGISPAVRQMAKDRKLRVIDATCPLVSKVHYEAIKFAKAGLHVLLIGHADHDEVIGTMGEIPGRISLVEDVESVDSVVVPDPERVAVITQTTLSVDETREIMEAVRRRFPNVKTPARDDICYATQNRQDAVRALAPDVDVLLVVGSQNSSNSLRLGELSEQLGTRAYLVDHADQVQPQWVQGAGRVGITAGASSPEYLTQAIVERVKRLGSYEIVEVGKPEPEIVFTMPREISLI